jgi:hypothetical protein
MSGAKDSIAASAEAVYTLALDESRATVYRLAAFLTQRLLRLLLHSHPPMSNAAPVSHPLRSYAHNEKRCREQGTERNTARITSIAAR